MTILIVFDNIDSLQFYAIDNATDEIIKMLELCDNRLLGTTDLTQESENAILWLSEYLTNVQQIVTPIPGPIDRVYYTGQLP